MLVRLLVLGLVIGSNNLAVALALGAQGQARHRVRIALVFGSFEFVVPLIGIWLGSAAARQIGVGAGWLGATLIVMLGAWAVFSGVRDNQEDEGLAELVTSWRGLLLLAAGLSVDNLVVGFSLGLGKASPLVVATTIAIFAVVFTLAGIQLGKISRRHWERQTKIASGLLLVGLGIAIAFGFI